MTLKNILRQRYSGTFFDSKLLNVVGPAIDKLDRAAQTRKDVPLDPAIPPFSLRARSNGSWQQFGGERFVEAGDRLPSLLQDRGLVPAGAEIVAPLVDEDYGSRGFSVADPEGNIWSFGTYDGEA